jgi:epoxyqueuosine reductase
MKEMSGLIKKRALEEGFHLVGITTARMPGKIKFLDTWLAAGYHGTMKWMCVRSAMRRDVRLLFPGVKAIICVGHNYYVPDELKTDPGEVLISRYARGKDYHLVMKKKLKLLLSQYKKAYPGLEGRICVDSAPVMEKIWAEAAGLGWQGKHTNLISPRIGSWFFLGEILVNMDLVPDQPVPDRCGKCEACLEACPTRAIIKPYLLDASRCISYLTIENRSDRLPVEHARKVKNWIFGCDICQQVCPWNKYRKTTDEINYSPSLQSGDMTFAYLMNLDESQFKQVFRNSPLLRTGYKCFIRNVQNACENRKYLQRNQTDKI